MSPKRSISKPTQKKSRRPIMPAISEQMKAWSAALAGEISDWPQVSTRIFFGFTALYRKDKMFAALPRTRAMLTASSLVFKIETPARTLRTRLDQDARVGSMQKGKARWFTFELSSGADLHDALDWLGRAYDAAGQKKTPK